MELRKDGADVGSVLVLFRRGDPGAHLEIEQSECKVTQAIRTQTQCPPAVLAEGWTSPFLSQTGVSS